MLQVKDDILKNNRLLEEKIKSHIDIYGKKFKQDLNAFAERIQKVTEANDKVVKTMPDINYKLSKIEQIEKFDVRTEHKMTSFEVRIQTILEQIEKIKTKYDKIVLDNLIVSGHIGGAHSQYANLSEYLLTNINDVSLLKLEKDELKKEVKSLKSKQDNIIKQTVNLVDGSVKRCNLYTDNKQKDFQLLLDSKMREFNEKIMEIRMNVCKIQMETEEAVNNLNIGFDKLKEENKFFMKDLLDQFGQIKNEMNEFKNEYKSKLNHLYKENTFIKKDTNNIKENIENMLKLIEYQERKYNKKFNDIKRNFDEPIEDSTNKFPKLKGSYLPFMGNNSPIKNRLTALSPSVRKNKKKLLNSINIVETSKENGIRRNNKKRNTVAYTKPILNEEMKKKLKEYIKEKSRVNSPKFLGVFAPILKNIINFKDDEISEKFNSLNTKTGDKLDFNSTIKTIKLEDKKTNNNKSENISQSNKNSNSNSESDSVSLSPSMSSIMNENEEKDQLNPLKIRRRSSSRKNFTRLSLRDGKKKLTKKYHNNINNQNVNNNNNNQKINKKFRRRASVGILGSANIVHKNDDISEIIKKNFHDKNKANKEYNNRNKNINKEMNDDANYIKRTYHEDSKNNYIKTGNNDLISQKEKGNINQNGENQFKTNNSKSRVVNLLNITNNTNNKNINNNINTISINRGNAINNRYNGNTLDTYSPLSKNHKRNYIITPSIEDQGLGCKIVSFDIPENIYLPQRMNQNYLLTGKKLKKKPNIKMELISPLDELYKQQYKKKMGDMKPISSNSNMIITNNNDAPKKLLPIFGRTAYAFYGANDKDAGINLTNSLDLNKNKNNLNGFQTLSRNFNTNNISNPFNVKSFPKLKNKFNTEKNEA